MNRYTIGGALLLTIAAAAGGWQWSRSNSVQVVAAGLSDEDGAISVNPERVSKGGTVHHTQVPMCFTSVGCKEVQAGAVGAVAQSLTIQAGQWYEVTVSVGAGDPLGINLGCWDETGPIPLGYTCATGDASCALDAAAACNGKPKLKDGVVKPMAFKPSPLPDAGTWDCTGVPSAQCRWVPADAGAWYCNQLACSVECGENDAGCAGDAGCHPVGDPRYACGIACGEGDAGCAGDAGCTLLDSGMAGCRWIPDKDAGTNYCNPVDASCAWVPNTTPGSAVLRFFALTASGLDVTLCPEVPCE